MKWKLMFAILAVVLLVGCAKEAAMEDDMMSDDAMDDVAPEAPAEDDQMEVIEVTPEEDAPAPVTTETIIIQARAAVPSEVTISPGSVVVFKHDGKVDSMILIRDLDNMKSPRIKSGESWQVTFPEAGEYKFVDIFNGFVKGTVMVE